MMGEVMRKCVVFNEMEVNQRSELSQALEKSKGTFYYVVHPNFKPAEEASPEEKQAFEHLYRLLNQVSSLPGENAVPLFVALDCEVETFAYFWTRRGLQLPSKNIYIIPTKYSRPIPDFGEGTNDEIWQQFVNSLKTLGGKKAIIAGMFFSIMDSGQAKVDPYRRLISCAGSTARNMKTWGIEPIISHALLPENLKHWREVSGT